MNSTKCDAFLKYKNDFSVLWGFHGTTDESYNKIKEGRNFKCNKRKDHWLGNGVYFFLNDPLKAQWWAGMAVRKVKRKSKHTSDIKKAVICCKIKVKNNKLLDLDTKVGRVELRKFIHELKNTDSPSFSDESDHNVHVLLCQIIDIMVTYCQYDVVKYNFLDENDKTRMISYGIKSHGQQVTVFNQQVIDFNNLEGEIYDA